MILGGLVTTSSSVLWSIALIVWAAVWGVLSLAIICTWSRPRSLWVLLGVLGPIGPLVALIVGMWTRQGDVDV